METQFYKFFEDLDNIFKRYHVEYFLKTQEPLMRNNINESFIRQKYFAQVNEVSWKPLSPFTIKKRKAKGTWYGAGASTLKETMTMWNTLTNNTRFRLRKRGSNYSAVLEIDEGIHADGRPIGGIIKAHQYGYVNQLTGTKVPKRPPLSLLKRTQKLLVVNAGNYFMDKLRKL